MNSNFSWLKIIDFIIDFLFGAIVFLVPIFFSFFLISNNVFELGKIFVFKILVLSLVPLLSIGFLLKSNNFNIFWKRYKLDFSVFLLVLSSYILSTVFSSYPGLSFFGLLDRQLGLLSFFYFFSFFLCTLYYLRDESKLRKLLIMAGLAGVVVSVYGLVQFVGWDFMTWTESAFAKKRSTSTFGQPNFLASYLLLVWPLNFYLIQTSRRSWQRIFWSVASFLSLACLFLTNSRGGYFSLLAISFLLAVYFLWKKRDQAKKIWRNTQVKIILASAGVVLLVFLFLLSRENYFVSRFKDTFNTSSATVTTRSIFWGSALKSLNGHNFWLGQGLETQGELYWRAYDRDWAVFGKVNDFPNRAHNIILDILLTRGFLGLVTLGLVIWRLWVVINKKKLNSEQSVLLAVLLFGLSASWMSLLFSFSIVTTNIYTAFFLAIILSLGEKNEDKKDDIRISRSLLAFRVLIILGLTGLSSWQINKEFNYYIADHYSRSLFEAQAQGNYYEAWELYGYIKDLKIEASQYHRQATYLFSEWLDKTDDKKMKKVLAKPAEKILESLPKNGYENQFARAILLNSLYSDNPDYAREAERILVGLIKINPHLPRLHRQLAKTQRNLGKMDLAIVSYNQALLGLPSSDDLRLNQEHRDDIALEKSRIYEDLGNLFFSQESWAEAEKYYQLAYKNNLWNKFILRKIANTYYKRKDLAKALWYNERAFVLDKNNYYWPLSIALLYQEKGDWKQVEKYAQLATALSPGNQEVRALLENIAKLKQNNDRKKK